MKSIVTFVLSFLLLGMWIFGCASAPPPTPWTWYKPNAANGEFNKIKYTCLQESQQQVSYSNANTQRASSRTKSITNETIFRACMEAQGWSYVPVNSIRNNSVANKPDTTTEATPKKAKKMIKAAVKKETPLENFEGNVAPDVIEMKKGVRFDHKAHQDHFKNCTQCHSKSEGGKIEVFGKNYAHTNCKGCHVEGGGPTSCKGCHK